MRFVLCDDDEMLTSMAEGVVASHGHEVVGIADTSMAATGLLEHTRPDAAIIDPSLGYNTDFDVLETAYQVGAKVIVFSFSAEEDLIGLYNPRPLVVQKPDLAALGRALEQLTARFDAEGHDRRHGPARPASGPEPTGYGDASAFYEALNSAVEHDTMMMISLAADGLHLADANAVAPQVAHVIRETDRLLVSAAAVFLFLPGGGEPAPAAVVRRLEDELHMPVGSAARHILVRLGEIPSDAFSRLKSGGEQSAT